jgi:hypothetical protein
MEGLHVFIENGVGSFAKKLSKAKLSSFLPKQRQKTSVAIEL